MPLLSIAPVVLGPDEIDRYNHDMGQSGVLPTGASHFVHALRQPSRHPEPRLLAWHDVTDSQEFVRKVWVAQRPDATDIVDESWALAFTASPSCGARARTATSRRGAGISWSRASTGLTHACTRRTRRTA